jgi:hypothetical protein
MGMAFPLSFMLVFAAAVVLSIAYLASLGIGSRPRARQKLWLIVMVVVALLTVGPLLFFAIGAVDAMATGTSPAIALGLFAVAAVILVLTYFSFRRERSSEGPDRHT